MNTVKSNFCNAGKVIQKNNNSTVQADYKEMKSQQLCILDIKSGNLTSFMQKQKNHIDTYQECSLTSFWSTCAPLMPQMGPTEYWCWVLILVEFALQTYVTGEKLTVELMRLYDIKTKTRVESLIFKQELKLHDATATRTVVRRQHCTLICSNLMETNKSKSHP